MARALQDFTEAAQLCHRARDEAATATAEGDLVRPRLLSLFTPESPRTRLVACVCTGAHVRVRAFGAERDLEALREQMSAVLEEVRVGRAQLVERVARFPHQDVGEERAIAGGAVVCG